MGRDLEKESLEVPLGISTTVVQGTELCGGRWQGPTVCHVF